MLILCIDIHTIRLKVFHLVYKLCYYPVAHNTVLCIVWSGIYGIIGPVALHVNPGLCPPPPPPREAKLHTLQTGMLLLSSVLYALNSNVIR